MLESCQEGLPQLGAVFFWSFLLFNSEVEMLMKLHTILTKGFLMKAFVTSPIFEIPFILLAYYEHVLQPEN